MKLLLAHKEKYYSAEPTSHSGTEGSKGDSMAVDKIKKAVPRYPERELEEFEGLEASSEAGGEHSLNDNFENGEANIENVEEIKDIESPLLRRISSRGNNRIN
jgi:hypothetical protein